ncbi:MAG TPA: hypothetical protein VFV38_44545, partial [Ktedonobacteraceae bacterium]|nr:hypothetical protein [Ktedonobacteraceae bacterium]
MSDQPSQEENAESGQEQSVHLWESEPEKRQSTVKSRKRREKSIFTEQRERVEALRARRRAGNIVSCPRARLAVEAKVWDANPWLLGTQPGAIDLRTGTLRPGRPNDYVRTIIPTAWKGLDTPAPRFEQFLREIFADREEGEREELIAFLQRLLGYGLTGYVKEHVFLLLYG